MNRKKRAKDVELDDATTAAIARLNALSFEAADPLSPPAHFLEYIKPGLFMKGRPNEYVPENKDHETSDEEQESLSDEDPDGLDEVVDQNWLELGDNDRVHISVYLGQEWVEAIEALDAIEPVEIPGLRPTPHPWQKKGAAQGHWLCEQPDFKIFFCGDEMGLGKTLMAVMMIKLAQPKPGFCIVIAPKTVGQQWQEECVGAFEQQEALRVIRVVNRNMSAHELYARRPDVIIVSYEFVEATHRRMQAAHAEDPARRSTSLFHTDFWDLQGYPIKRLILDEAHRINNTKSKRYMSVRAIPAKATIMLSGTFPHNRWNGWGGPVSFAKNQPLTDISSFNRVFGSWDYDNKLEPEPVLPRIKLLQRYLMRFTVARPADVLKLPGINHYKSTFKLNSDDEASSEDHFLKYMQAQQYEKDRHVKKLKEKMRKKGKKSGKVKGIEGHDSGKKEDSLKVLIHAIRSQQASIHALLLDTRFQTRKNASGFVLEDCELESDEESEDGYVPSSSDDSDSSSSNQSDDEDQDQGKATTMPILSQSDMDALHATLTGDNSELERDSRKRWLNHIASDPEVVFKSARLTRVLDLYEQLRRDHPDRKIVISSQYLRFLDMIKSGLRQVHGIDGFEYNGVIADAVRQKNLETFRDSSTSCSQPLYLSGKAGGEGINIPEASILIQTEVWWNRNAELQLYSRLLRQGQQHKVIIIRLQGRDLSIDDVIIQIQSKKKTVNTVLMRPLVRPHNVPPQIPEMLYQAPYLTS
ncbi:hypothetical protein AA0112_g3578 [Alternaria arborescens]|nr:hypothetical protein AA0111_g9006 [Alternaria arborescens]RYN39619.1 hypothetical protein AA0112_g3578 [Alternaria arborescens]RYO23789.1 hypothetical protein AA0111_g9006 [Alternaria arborescens]